MGSWRLGYNGLPGRGRAACNPDCRAQIGGHLRFEYRPPKWLGTIWPKVSLSIPLRPAKVINTSDDVWFCMKKSPEVIKGLIEARFAYFPDDQDVNGRGLVYVSFENTHMQNVRE